MSSHKENNKNDLHDKCKQVVVFHNHLYAFFDSLIKSFPEFKRDIAKCLKHYKESDRYIYITKTLKLMEPHVKKFSQYDEGIFSNDYCKDALKLVPGLDVKKIFHLINDSAGYDKKEIMETKKNIFNHLQSIYISGQLAVNQINKFNTAMDKQKTMLMDMLKNLNLDATLREKVEKLAADEKATESVAGSGFDINKLGELLGEDNFIFQLAKDVANEINLGNEDLSNPVDAINILFSNNGQRLQELIVTVGEKIEQKVRSGEIDQAKLYEHAQNMKEKLHSVVGNIPGMQGFTDPVEMTKMFAESFSELNDEEQIRFKDAKDLIDNNPDMKSWTDEQKTKFDEYAKFIFARKTACVMPQQQTHDETQDETDADVTDQDKSGEVL